MIVITTFRWNGRYLIDPFPVDGGFVIRPDRQARHLIGEGDLDSIPIDIPLLGRVNETHKSMRYVRIVGTVKEAVNIALSEPGVQTTLNLIHPKAVSLTWTSGPCLHLTVDESGLAHIRKITHAAQVNNPTAVSDATRSTKERKLYTMRWQVQQSAYLNELFAKHNAKTAPPAKNREPDDSEYREALLTPPEWLRAMVDRARESFWISPELHFEDFGPFQRYSLGKLQRLVESASNGDFSLQRMGPSGRDPLFLKAVPLRRDREAWNARYPVYAMRLDNPNFWLHACQLMGQRMCSRSFLNQDGTWTKRVLFSLFINEKLLSFWFPEEKLEKDDGPGYTPDDP